MYILGLHTGHDACAVLYDEYKILAAVPLERVTRKKNDGALLYPEKAIREILNQAGISKNQIDVIAMARAGIYWQPDGYIKNIQKPASRFPLLSSRKKRPNNLEIFKHVKKLNKTANEIFDAERYYQNFGFPHKPKLFFFNHHFAHALAAIFHTDWDDALIYTADGGGDDVCYSHRILRNGKIHELWGGEQDSMKSERSWRSSIGYLYAHTTEALGFVPLRHEGKVLGLAAHGKPRFAQQILKHFRVDQRGRIFYNPRLTSSRRYIRNIAKNQPREDVAASIQKALETLILDSVGKLLKQHNTQNIALSGGIFANVLLNQKIAQQLPVKNIFIYPAMSDQGLPAGGALEFLLQRDGSKTWLQNRHPIQNLYLGKNYDNDVQQTFQNAGAKICPLENTSLEDKVAQLLHHGHIVALYLGRMEYGPRALGARSILAAPTDHKINQSLNQRLSRTEFMPFAPVVTQERATEIFNIPPSMLYAAQFMTITCSVNPQWHDKIPAVVHVDGTARPQIISRNQNQLYYDILKAYEKITNIPVLINTSFNAHEEPIINTPQEAVEALKANRVDYLVSQNHIWKA